MKIVIIAVIVIMISLIIYMYRQAFEDHVKKATFTFPMFPSKIGDFRIFFISDIHRRVITDAILQQLTNNVDIIIIGGDLTEKGVPEARVKENLNKLSRYASIFFVWGNNDYEMPTEKLRALLRESGVIELKNAVYYLKNNQVALIGLDDLTQELPSLESVFNYIHPESFQILICHNPSVLSMLPENHSISLMLSGHTHGGQIRIFGFGPYKLGGITKVNGMTVLVSNGYGTTLFPLRLGAKAETHLITITNK